MDLESENHFKVIGIGLLKAFTMLIIITLAVLGYLSMAGFLQNTYFDDHIYIFLFVGLFISGLSLWFVRNKPTTEQGSK